MEHLNIEENQVCNDLSLTKALELLELSADFGFNRGSTLENDMIYV